jgi:dihydrofolate reductase
MNMIVAVNQHGIIGRNQTMLWHIPEDMKYFRRQTMHSIVIMGRKTYDSLPGGPLDSRINIIITTQPEKYSNKRNQTSIFCTLDGCEKILQTLKTTINKPVFVIGGADIYQQFFEKCDKIFVTMVNNEESDGVSILSLLQTWQSTYTMTSRTPKSMDSKTDYEFLVFEKPDSHINNI